MENAFEMPGDLSSWTSQLLDEIDRCFVKNYVAEDGVPVPYLFFPNCAENLNRYIDYYEEVDRVFRMHSRTAPKYAREYFAYYSIWQMRQWPFPVPLGTKSVVGILNDMARSVTVGFSEVSPLPLRP